MQKIRKKLTVLIIGLIIIAVAAAVVISLLLIKNDERKETEQMLLLLCETGEQNLDYYFNNMQDSINKVASYVEADLKSLESSDLEKHIENVRHYFEEAASKTGGVLTFYYRIDPEVSETVKGFWYTDLTGSGFTEHEVTDITLYDTGDSSQLVWFTVPKNTGEAVWLSPPVPLDGLEYI